MLTLTWASKVCKVQGPSLEQVVIDFDLRKQKSFGPGQMDVVISRVKTSDNLSCKMEFRKSVKTVKKDALLKYERLKQNDLFSTRTRNDSTCKTLETLNLFNISFDNSENKFLILAYRCRNDVAVSNKFDANGVSFLSFKKHTFADRVFTSMFIENNPCICKYFFSCCNIYKQQIS